MKAIVMRGIGEPLSVEELELTAPGPGEVEVRIEAAGLCHSDLHYLSGGLTCRTPIVLGHEGAGEVLSVGEGVTTVQPGDKVILTWRPRCGQCEFCLKGRPGLCRMGAVHSSENVLLRGGTRLSRDGEAIYHLMGASCFAERAIVSQESILAVDPAIPAQVAAIVGCAVITGMGAVLNCMPDVAGKRVAVIGAGGVGLAAVMAAVWAGANEIIVSDLVAGRLEKAREVGATHVIDSSREDFVERVIEISDGGADYVLEAIGNKHTIRQGFDALRTGGTEVVVGVGRAGEEVSLPINGFVQHDRHLVGALYGSSNTPLQIPEILRMYASGRLPLERLLDRTFSLDEANEAVAHMREGAMGRPVFLPQAHEGHRL